MWLLEKCYYMRLVLYAHWTAVLICTGTFTSLSTLNTYPELCVNQTCAGPPEPELWCAPVSVPRVHIRLSLPHHAVHDVSE